MGAAGTFWAGCGLGFSLLFSLSASILPTRFPTQTRNLNIETPSQPRSCVVRVSNFYTPNHLSRTYHLRLTILEPLQHSNPLCQLLHPPSCHDTELIAPQVRQDHDVDLRCRTTPHQGSEFCCHPAACLIWWMHLSQSQACWLRLDVSPKPQRSNCLTVSMTASNVSDKSICSTHNSTHPLLVILLATTKWTTNRMLFPLMLPYQTRHIRTN